MVSLGTVPPDSTASSFPGRPHGDPGEASGEWGYCGLPGPGEQERRYWVGEVGGRPSPNRPLLPVSLSQPRTHSGFLRGQASRLVDCNDLVPSFVNLAWTQGFSCSAWSIAQAQAYPSPFPALFPLIPPTFLAGSFPLGPFLP